MGKRFDNDRRLEKWDEIERQIQQLRSTVLVESDSNDMGDPLHDLHQQILNLQEQAQKLRQWDGRAQLIRERAEQ